MRLRALVSVAALVAGALLVPAPAQALEQDEVFDVKLSAKDIRINKGGCQDIPYTATHTQGVLESFSLGSYVYAKDRELSFTFSKVENSAGPLKATWFWCPSNYGPGTFTLKQNQVRWMLHPDLPTTGQFMLKQELKQTLKQDSKAKVSKVAKRRGRVSLTAKVTHFNLLDYTNAWTRVPKGTKVKLQLKKGKKWKTIDTGRVGKKGTVKLNGKAARKKATYRVVSSASKRTWSATKSFKR
ncbi:hypothetical protein [Nocardioides gilvus]|uniref:hypothetical protein n=1 Tax=Nocardioides gilvus TaxID=1735589 RepID=UPI000D74E2FF|nr:hypothetical protein [Nocardioides gilvus]